MTYIFETEDFHFSILYYKKNFLIIYYMNQKEMEFSKYAAAAAAKSLQSCQTLCHPIDISQSGSPVPGISRQEHWSGLPFPSPVHESEK